MHICVFPNRKKITVFYYNKLYKIFKKYEGKKIKNFIFTIRTDVVEKIWCRGSKNYIKTFLSDIFWEGPFWVKAVRSLNELNNNASKSMLSITDLIKVMSSCQHSTLHLIFVKYCILCFSHRNKKKKSQAYNTKNVTYMEK